MIERNDPSLASHAASETKIIGGPTKFQLSSLYGRICLGEVVAHIILLTADVILHLRPSRHSMYLTQTSTDFTNETFCQHALGFFYYTELAVDNMLGEGI